MDIKYVYVKARADFGKQCIFDICGPNLDEEIKPNPQEMRNYILKSPCHVGTQLAKQMALHEVQTSPIVTKNSGMYHYEGGWPKEINPQDLEATARFRRRVEKDDAWVPKLRNLLEVMEHNVLSNNTIDIYEHYFDDMIPTPLTQDRDIRLLNVFEDQQAPGRPVNNIDWSVGNTKLVISYFPTDVSKDNDDSNIAYIWDIESPNKPYAGIVASSPILVCQFNPRDSFILAGGLMSGQVCSWDIRVGNAPVRTSYPRYSHRYLTSAVKWVHAKTNTEFFSTSWDGQALWWDTRNLRQPIEQLILDLSNPNDPSMENSIGICSANFEPAMGTKFMFGLQNGMVVSGSRKVKTNAEKLALRFNAHTGPVLSVDRNVFSPKVFLSVGGSSCRIWAEDTREGSLMTIRSPRHVATMACWNKVRHSLFYVIKENGRLEVYDILESLQKPLIELHLSESRLTTMGAHENGYLLAVGDNKGNVFLTESSDALGRFDRSERNLMTAGLDRNSKHVKAVDARIKEMKITKYKDIAEPAHLRRSSKSKKKTKVKDTGKGTGKKEAEDDKMMAKDKKRRSTLKKKVREDAPEMLAAEELFFETLEKEKGKFETDEDVELKYLTLTRKFDSKQSRRAAPDNEKVDAEDEEAKKKGKRKKPPTLKKRRSVQSEDAEEDRSTNIYDTISELLTETSRVDTVPSLRPVGLVKKKKRKKEKKFRLRLRRPCKVVCRPKVCCWRKIWRSGKNGKKRLEGERRRRLSSEPLRKKKSKSPADIEDTITDLPVELETQLSIARKELRVSKKPIGWSQRKELVTRIIQVRAMAKKRRVRRLKVSSSKDMTEEKRSYELPMTCEGATTSKTTDPCPQQRSWTVIKDVEALLAPTEVDSEECEKAVSKHYLGELEAHHGRVYPRISAFTPTE